MENTGSAHQNSPSLSATGMENSPPPPSVGSIILLVTLFILATVSGFLWWRNYGVYRFYSPQPAEEITSPASPSFISGKLDLNGIVDSEVVMQLVATNRTDNSAILFSTETAPHDDESWYFDKALAGDTYTLQAILTKDGQEIARSSPSTVTAPANNVILTLNVESEEPPRTAVIVGDIVIHGYIPPDSTVTIEGRKIGSTEFTMVVSKLPAKTRQVMSYTTAQAGVTYEVQGTMYAADGKTVLGTSNILTVTAPAVREVLTINSSAPVPATPTPTSTPPITAPPASSPTTPPLPTATPIPAPSAVISGKITFNGIAPPDSRIVIFQKVYNSEDYQVALDNLKPVDGVTWVWKNPTPSTWYDLIAVLKQKQSNGTDKDISTSSVVSVAAPATNIRFTLNSGFNLSAPNGKIITKCGSLSGDTWGAQVIFDAQHNAASYWYQIGESNGGSEIINSTQNADGSTPVTVAVPFKNGKTYYARYAVATLKNLNTGNSQFSPFSTTQQLQCGG